LLLETGFHGSPQNLWTMTLQDRVQSIHILVPVPRPTMHNLGEIANRRLSQLQQLLALQIAPAAFPGYSRYQSRAMLG
jgi:hypothetical protein